MKKLLLLTLLCFSINGFAHNWLKLTDNVQGGSIYADVGSLKTYNGFVYLWVMQDRVLPNKLGFLSSIMKFQIECGIEMGKVLSYSHYTQNMGQGFPQTNTLASDYYFEPGSAGYSILEFACDRAK